MEDSKILSSINEESMDEGTSLKSGSTKKTCPANQICGQASNAHIGL